MYQDRLGTHVGKARFLAGYLRSVLVGLTVWRPGGAQWQRPGAIKKLRSFCLSRFVETSSTKYDRLPRQARDGHVYFVGHLFLKTRHVLFSRKSGRPLCRSTSTGSSRPSTAQRTTSTLPGLQRSGYGKRLFGAILCTKTIIVLPRQARDRHGKSTTQKERDAFVSQPKIELATDFLLRMIQGCVETHLLFFEFSLCLSRACLGKMTICNESGAFARLLPHYSNIKIDRLPRQARYNHQCGRRLFQSALKQTARVFFAGLRTPATTRLSLAPRPTRPSATRQSVRWESGPLPDPGTARARAGRRSCAAEAVRTCRFCCRRPGL